MKKLIFVVFVLLVSLVHGQSSKINEIILALEDGNHNKFLKMDFSDLNFDEEKIHSALSAITFDKTLGNIKNASLVFENHEFPDSLNINFQNCRVEKIVFINCRFEKNVVFDKAEISQHLIFMSCCFDSSLEIKDFSTKTLTFLANEFKQDFAYNTPFRHTKIEQFYFIFNQVRNFSIEAHNIFIPCEYSGALVLGSVYIAYNSMNKIFLSGYSITDLSFFLKNYVDKIELNALKIDYMFLIKNSKINVCEMFNINERENAQLVFLGNRIGTIIANSVDVKNMEGFYNQFDRIILNTVVCRTLLNLRNNIFKKDAEIDLKNSDLSKIKFYTFIDSFYIAKVDTLPAEKHLKKRDLCIQRPVFFIYDEQKDDTLQICLEVKDRILPKENESCIFNIVSTTINERNWFVDFDYIKKNDDGYRINPKQDQLSKRHEIYTSIQKAYADQGNWQQADACFYEWKEFQRKNYLRLSDQSIFTKLPNSLFHYLNWLSCGYGIRPLRIFPFAFFLILLFALFYFLTPMPISNLELYLISSNKLKRVVTELSPDQMKNAFSKYDFNFNSHRQDLINEIMTTIPEEDLIEILGLKPKSKYNFTYFWNCFYFSFSTFTTVGIGDWYPSGKLNKAIVMLEGSLGWLCLGLFITTYANILLR